jgi:hypothetical protein
LQLRYANVVNKSPRAPEAWQHSVIGDQVSVYSLSGRLGLGYSSVSNRCPGCFPGTFAQSREHLFRSWIAHTSCNQGSDAEVMSPMAIFPCVINVVPAWSTLSAKAAEQSLQYEWSSIGIGGTADVRMTCPCSAANPDPLRFT